MSQGAEAGTPIPRRRRSLSVGKEVAIAPDADVTSWVSDNAHVSVTNEGVAFAPVDQIGHHARATLTGYDANGHIGCIQPVTIVPWDVREGWLEMEVDLAFGRSVVLFERSGEVYFVTETGLFRSDPDGHDPIELFTFKKKQRYRSDYPPIVETPHGFFWAGEHEILYSPDLQQWRSVLTRFSRSMFHGLCAKRCARTGDTLVFFADYDLDATRDHGIWRGRMSVKGKIKWEQSASFIGTEPGKKGHYFIPRCRHVHFVVVDPYTGWLWAGTGDHDSESGIWVSRNDGNSWELFALGSQKFRALSMWFTPEYVYWNMDTHSEIQHIMRTPRSQLIVKGKIQPLTPIVSQSMTIPGAKYLVLAGTRRMPEWTEGRVFEETAPNNIHTARLLQLSAPGWASYTIVHSLPFGAQWYQVPVTDANGEEWTLMSAGPESRVPGTSEVPFRDWATRLFALRELQDGSCECFEAFIGDPDPEVTEPKRLRYHRIDPRLQSGDGSIYLACHNSEFSGAIRARVQTV